MAYEPGAPHSIKIIDTEICSAKLKADHPELFHYTGRGGFEPIVTTNTLWATHFRHLNDEAEISTLRPQLLETMAAVLDKEVKRYNAGIRNQFYRRGGARPIARDFVASLYASTFERSDANFAVGACTTSFSTHAADTPYERENGLESQWRYYAQDGFCLVFDTDKLGDLLGREFDRLDFTHLNLEDVRYLRDGARLPDYFDFIEPALQVVAEQVFKRFEKQEMGTVEFLRCATLLKRASFREEREVRIVAIPGAPGYQEQGAREYRDQFVKKPIPATRDRPKCHITLFEGVDVKLPIKRVIVGPSEQQADNAEFARSIVDCEVVLSRPRDAATSLRTGRGGR
jgi:hypothetical protein